MDKEVEKVITEIIGTVVAILTIGSGLYASYKADMTQHKTTQGKLDAVVSTTVKHETDIETLIKDFEALKSDFESVKKQ